MATLKVSGLYSGVQVYAPIKPAVKLALRAKAMLFAWYRSAGYSTAVSRLLVS